jgi:hypothetical protein
MIFRPKTDEDPAVKIRQGLEAKASPDLRVIHRGLFEDYEPPAPALAGELLRERGELEGPGGDCPLCGGTLERGAASVHSTFLRFLIAGISWQSAWFRSAQTGKKQVVFGPWSKTAARCKDCGTLLVRGA